MNLDTFIDLALQEDIGDGDHTSLACIPADAVSSARLLVKEEGIIAGVKIATAVFKKVDPSLRVKVLLKDGSPVKKGDIALVVKGSARSILTSERLVLNIMQRMSGIATTTARMKEQLKGTKTVVLDTRKTTPNLRFLEKEAVRIGGGSNHRTGLYDMILIKDNHVDYAGGIENAIVAASRYKAKTGRKLKVEIEVRNLAELKEVLRTGKVDRIMLDNFTVPQLKKALSLIPARFETEASGGITLDNIRSYALTGVDYISCGALTHSVKSLDLSLKAVKA